MDSPNPWQIPLPMLVAGAIVVSGMLIGLTIYCCVAFDSRAWAQGEPAFMDAQIAYAFSWLFLAFLDITVVRTIRRRRAEMTR
jgi:hypothetical protein